MGLWGKVGRVVLFGVLTMSCQTEKLDSGDVVSQTEQSIIGGQASASGDFPSVGALVVDEGRRGLCTATLVAPEWVLTAAHCIDPGTLRFASQQDVTNNTIVMFNTLNIRRPTTNARIIQAAETMTFSDFDSPGDTDIGLIRLSEPVTDIEPTPINTKALNSPVGVDMTLVGYGLTDSSNSNSAGTQYYLETNSTSCSSFGIGNDDFLCLGRGVCSGDSGGPTFVDIDGTRHVAGVASFGDQNCNFLGAYMRTDANDSLSFLVENAPTLACKSDNVCDEELCMVDGEQLDPDCRSCEADSDCNDPENEFCDNGACSLKPGLPGAIGSSCSDEESEVCQGGGICYQDDDGLMCTRLCEPSEGCPSDFECIASGEENVCWPKKEESGLCSTGSGSNGWAIFLLLFGLLGLKKRRVLQSPL